MHEAYDYRTIRVAPRSWTRVAEQIRQKAGPAVSAAGGTLFGVWTGQIGLGADEGVLISAWRVRDSLERSSRLGVEGVDAIVEQRAERLVATVRPVSPEPPLASGVYAHRWFDIREESWPEFLRLSEAAWPDFEARHGARIVGFFRSTNVEAPNARVLLLTNYPSLAVWESSRMEHARGETELRVREHFARRHELTLATIVRTTRLLGLES